jgi:tetrahydromethanopterin S-methyltransferase subunit A
LTPPAEPSDTTPPYVPGAFVVGSADSPVAVCSLATQSLLPRLEGRAEIAIAGRVYTENVGIEKMVQNLLANRRLRVLIVCGRESRHRVGQAILSLHRNGVDPVTHRIRGATGPDPVLANLSDDEIAAFQQRFEVVDLIGEEDPERIIGRAARFTNGEGRVSPDLSPYPPRPQGEGGKGRGVIPAEPDPPGAWTYDPLGFFLVGLDREGGLMRLEHYDQQRRLLHVIEGSAASTLCETAIRQGLLSRLDHAAYLGRELAKAEAALRLGLRYEQDSPLRRPPGG